MIDPPPSFYRSSEEKHRTSGFSDSQTPDSLKASRLGRPVFSRSLRSFLGAYQPMSRLAFLKHLIF